MNKLLTTVMRKTILLTLSAIALSAIGTGQSYAQTSNQTIVRPTIPPRNAALGSVIQLHGMPTPNANGFYNTWAWGSDGMVGWIKQNPDGSSFQLIGHFTPPNLGTSSSLKSLVLYDIKTGGQQTLFPPTPNTINGWVVSWVGENYNILNRTSNGLSYGSRGKPGSTIVREISDTSSPGINVAIQRTASAAPPAPNAISAPTLGSYTLSISSPAPLPHLELVAIIDNSKGEMVHRENVQLGPRIPNARTASATYTLGGKFLAQPDGEYIINFELQDKQSKKFLKGTSDLLIKRTLTSTLPIR